MKIILIEPPQKFKFDYGFREYDLGKMWQPIITAYIASILEADGHTVKILDADAEGKDINKIRETITQYVPEITGIATAPYVKWRIPQFSFNSAIKTAEEAKRAGSTIVLYGPHPTLWPTQILSKYPFVDFCIRGEPEYTFKDLVKALDAGADVKSMKGISFRTREGIIHTEKRNSYRNIDSMPFPAYHLLPMSKYYDAILPQPFTVMLTSRGCVNKCIFCLVNAIDGRIYRARSPKNVVSEIEFLISNFNIKSFNFMEEIFTLNMKRAEKICDLIIERGLNIQWRCQTRADRVNPSLLNKIAESGCVSINYGVESGSQYILEILRKNITKEQIRKTVQWTKGVGIKTICYFMLGNPGETKKSIKESVDFAVELGSGSFWVTTAYPQTELYDMAKKQGLVTEDDDWEVLYKIAGRVGNEFTTNEINTLYKKARGKAKRRLIPKILLKSSFKSIIRRVFSLFKQNAIHWSLRR